MSIVLTYATVQREFPHKCHGLPCAICRFVTRKFNDMQGKRNVRIAARKRGDRILAEIGS